MLGDSESVMSLLNLLPPEFANPVKIWNSEVPSTPVIPKSASEWGAWRALSSAVMAISS